MEGKAMASEKWTVQADLVGEFIIKNESIVSRVPVFVGLRQLSLEPKVNEDGKYAGIHQLEAILVFEKQDETPLEPRYIYDHAKRLIDNITSLISLVSGQPAFISGDISIKQRLLDNPPTTRLIIVSGSKVTSIAPPVLLSSQFLTALIPPKIQRSIRWLARGLATRDSVDRLIALNNALELLAGLINDAPKRNRKCKNCGYEEIIGPGLRERTVHYLTK